MVFREIRDEVIFVYLAGNRRLFKFVVVLSQVIPTLLCVTTENHKR